MKTCATCGETKPLSEFYVSKGKVRHRCKDCEKAWQREFMRSRGGNPYKTQHERACIECGKTWTTANPEAKYCSNACQAAHEHGPDRRPKADRAKLADAEKRRRTARRKLARAAQGKHGKHVLTAGWCARCGKSAVTQPGSRAGEIFYCSGRCRRREWAALRRRGGRLINRQAIYRRDRWRCQIPDCVFPSRAVARTKPAPHPKAPVLDHIIPLSEWPDGTVPENLQTAHSLCNSLKREHGGGEQLMLIG